MDIVTPRPAENMMNGSTAAPSANMASYLASSFSEDMAVDDLASSCWEDTTMDSLATSLQSFRVITVNVPDCNVTQALIS